MSWDAVERSLWVGLGGLLGANARYWLGAWIIGRWGDRFPWATLAINVTGSFLLGLFLALLAGREGAASAPALRLLVATGFLGAYTTFSTFTAETLALAGEGAWSRAVANVAGSLALGLLAVWLGALAGRGLRTL